MKWLIVVVVVLAIALWIKNKLAGLASPAAKRVPLASVAPEFTITITTELAPGARSEATPVDVGELTPTGDARWVLNPATPLPLTVVGAGRATASALKTLLDHPQYWSDKVPDVALIIAQHNLRFVEVDSFIVQHKERFDNALAQLIALSPDWLQATERDRDDLRREFEEQARQSLGISVGRADLALLLGGQPADFEEDDALVARFDGNASLYAFYLAQLGRRQTVCNVKADDVRRKAWEQLVDKGFARRGRDIPPELLLDGLRLKDINELLSGQKVLGRKAKAIEAALVLPDLQERLAAHISFREMFQALPPPDLEVSGLARAFAYATAVATIVQQTYYIGMRTLEATDPKRRESSLLDAWEVRSWQEPLPACAARVCKKYERLPARLPPYHVGCHCELRRAFKDD